MTFGILQTSLAGKGKDNDSRFLQKPAHYLAIHDCFDVREWCYFHVYV